MTSLLTIRAAEGPGAAPWEVDAVPGAYEEAGRAQFSGMPGIRWVRDSASPNGRGFYRGDAGAVGIVASLLESAGVCKVRGNELPTSVSALRWSDSPCLQAFERLRAYQQDGASWLVHHLRASGGALLADEMGLGKTPQAIVALSAVLPQGSRTSIGPSVQVVAPASVCAQWHTEIARWGREDLVWRISSYEKFSRAVAKDAKRLAHELPTHAPPASALVLDEIHYCSNPKAGRTKAVRAWLASNPTALRLGLSGTPMTARPRDLWSPLDLLHPQRWGREWLYQRRYCGGHDEAILSLEGNPVLREDGTPRTAWQADGATNLAELHARLAGVMLRRTKQQVGAELPPRTRIVHEVTLPVAARRNLRRATAALTQASRAGVDGLLREAEAYKLEAAEAIAREVMAAGSRPLLLTLRKRSAHALGASLRCVVATGEDAAATRGERLREAPCAVATLYSVAEGLNLTGFDCIVFVGLDWVPAKILQGEARIHRIGQDKPVTIYYLVANGTIDEVVRARVLERLDTLGAVLGDEGDEGRLAEELGGGSEEDLLASIVLAAKEATT